MRTKWNYKYAHWESLCDYYSAFTYGIAYFSNYRDASESCEDITEVIECAAVEAYIHRSRKDSKPKQTPWFTKECDLTYKEKIRVHKNFLQNPTH